MRLRIELTWRNIGHRNNQSLCPWRQSRASERAWRGWFPCRGWSSCSRTFFILLAAVEVSNLCSEEGVVPEEERRWRMEASARPGACRWVAWSRSCGRRRRRSHRRSRADQSASGRARPSRPKGEGVGSSVSRKFVQIWEIQIKSDYDET